MGDRLLSETMTRPLISPCADALSAIAETSITAVSAIRRHARRARSWSISAEWFTFDLWIVTTTLRPSWCSGKRRGSPLVHHGNHQQRLRRVHSSPTCVFRPKNYFSEHYPAD